MGTMIPEKRQTQTLLFCMWGATDPGAQALVDPERALWALGAGTAGSPPPLTRVERMLGSGSLLNRAWGGQCFPNQPLASWAPLRGEQEWAGPQAVGLQLGVLCTPPRLAYPSIPQKCCCYGVLALELKRQGSWK